MGIEYSSFGWIVARGSMLSVSADGFAYKISTALFR